MESRGFVLGYCQRRQDSTRITSEFRAASFQKMNSELLVSYATQFPGYDILDIPMPGQKTSSPSSHQQHVTFPTSFLTRARASRSFTTSPCTRKPSRHETAALKHQCTRLREETAQTIRAIGRRPPDSTGTCARAHKTTNRCGTVRARRSVN